jgi:serine/threonine-protein kinase ULK/ATG1
LIIPREYLNSYYHRINNISQHCEDVLRKMLVVDPKKRIDWNELFEHKIVYYKEE